MTTTTTTTTTKIIMYRKQYNACRMKTKHKALFWCACNQISGSKPFIFLLKNNIFWSALRFELTTAHIITVLTAILFKNIVELYACQLLFHFFKKKFKKVSALVLWCEILFFILLVNKLILRTDAIPLCRVIIQHVLYNNNLMFHNDLFIYLFVRLVGVSCLGLGLDLGVGLGTSCHFVLSLLYSFVCFWVVECWSQPLFLFPLIFDGSSSTLSTHMSVVCLLYMWIQNSSPSWNV